MVINTPTTMNISCFSLLLIKKESSVLLFFFLSFLSFFFASYLIKTMMKLTWMCFKCWSQPLLKMKKTSNKTVHLPFYETGLSVIEQYFFIDLTFNNEKSLNETSDAGRLLMTKKNHSITINV